MAEHAVNRRQFLGKMGAFTLAAPLLTSSALGQPGRGSRGKGKNIVLILSDDHRYDLLGFHENAPEWLETPAFDRMAQEGAHMANAFVTLSLCSPSRASILTGKNAFNHGVVDNARRVPEGTVFFPQYLQESGYKTAFIGKWHMGASTDEPRPGFDHWISFRGQGHYFDQTMNINGKHVEHEGYITDLLTDYALDWLGEQQGSDEPFFMMLSHKAVHHEFTPAPRHKGRYADKEIPYPATFWNTEENRRGLPRWVLEQRYSWHGVDYPFYNQLGDFDDVYRSFVECVLGLDDSVGQVLDYLKESGQAEDTVVIYMGDNGFSLGEHGILDKRQAYEESMRIPMLAWAPGQIEPGTRLEEMVLNIDIAPSIMELTGNSIPGDMDGVSFLPLLEGKTVPWRDEVLYTYYWEYNFPHTPTTYALRTDKYKYIFYHGIWDVNELFDLEEDPIERVNLAIHPDYEDKVQEMHDRLFARLQDLGAVDVEFRKPPLWQADRRLIPGKYE